MADEYEVLQTENIKKDYPLLSAQELIKCKKHHFKSIQNYGQKRYLPTGNSTEKNQIESVIDERIESLMEQRVVRGGDLQCAVWDSTSRKAFVFKTKGKFMHHVGERVGSKLALYPEEILYLMETCYLELIYDGMPQSIQEAYSLILEEPLALEKFQVYSHLSRLGYTVVRHRKRLQSPIKTEETVNIQHKMSEIVEETDRQNRISSGIEVNINQKHFEVDGCEIFSKITESKENCSHKVKSCLWEGIDIPNMAGKTELILEPPSPHLLPKNVSPQKKSYVINIAAIKNECLNSENERFNNSEKYDSRRYREASQTNDWIYDHKNYRNSVKDRKDKYEYQNTFYNSKNKYNKSNYHQVYKQNRKRSYHQKKFPKPVSYFGKMSKTANCWKEYKNELNYGVCSVKKIQCSSNSTVIKDNICALVKPSEVLTTDKIFSKINIYKNHDLKKINFTKESLEDESDLKQVDFDVYLPNTHYKRKDPGPPAHRIKVKRLTDTVPKLSDFVSPQLVANDDIPLHYAIVDNGLISFYSFGEISLPSLCNSTT